MDRDALVDRAAATLVDNVSRLTRRLRQRQVSAQLSGELAGELTAPESAALSRLVREAPATAAELARAENIRPQSMGATVAALEGRGLLTRQRDPYDGRRVLLTVTEAGRALTEHKRTARGVQVAQALSEGFTDDELEQLVALAPLLGRLAGHLA